MFKIFNDKFGSSTEQIDILEISEGIIKLRDDRYRVILESSSLNFELRSEEEQDMIIDIYEGFLNSLGFPLQVLIKIREIDIDEYISSISHKIKTEKEQIYKLQLTNYRKFIRGLVKDNKVLTRQFFVVIPIDKQDITKENKVRDLLSLRVDVVTKGLSRLGIIVKQLDSIQAIQQFYSFYNPSLSKTQPLNRRTVTSSEALVLGEKR